MDVKVGDILEILVNDPYAADLRTGNVVIVTGIQKHSFGITQFTVSGGWSLNTRNKWLGHVCYKILSSQNTHQGSKTYRFESLMHGYWCELREIPNDLSRYWYRSDVVKDWGKVWYDPGENFQTVLNHYKLTLCWTENNPGTQFTDLGLEIKDVPKEDTPVPKHKCRCEMSVLWTRGCGCGGV